ncbi:MAG: flagellar basal body P-ring formation chaperone FlgA [Bryobacteraceae bacterium]
MTGIFLFTGLLLLSLQAKALEGCGPSAAPGKECDQLVREPLDPDQSETNKAQSKRSGGMPVNLTNTRRPLTSEEIEKAIRESLGSDASDAQIRILEFTLNSVVPGRVEFPLSGASPPLLNQPDRPFLWRGRVIGQLGEDSACWARVQVTTTRKIVRTRVTLLAGEVIKASELESLHIEACPLLTPKDEEISDYVGLSAKRSLPALALLNKNVVEAPPLVRRGNVVHVTAIAGQARITFDGEAHSNGYLGQSIQVTNVHSGRSFFGSVSGENSVLVTVTPAATL